LQHCQKGDRLYIISGKPVPYAFGVEFLFTRCSQKGHCSPIDGLVDAIIGNKELVTRPVKGKHGAPGVYKAIGNGLLENKVTIPVFNYNTEQIFTSPTGIGGGGSSQHCGKKRKVAVVRG
jgi:hypothetical protein